MTLRFLTDADVVNATPAVLAENNRELNDTMSNPKSGSSKDHD